MCVCETDPESTTTFISLGFVAFIGKIIYFIYPKTVKQRRHALKTQQVTDPAPLALVSL